MQTVIVSSLTDATGNKTTAERMQKIFEGLGHSTSLREAKELDCSLEKAEKIVRENDLIVIVHLWRSGKPIVEALDHMKSAKALISVIGGTDANMFAFRNECRESMRRVIERSRKIIAFDPFLLGQLRAAFPSIPDLSEKGVIIPQAVSLPKEVNADVHGGSQLQTLQERSRGSRRAVARLLLIAGSRPVKACQRFFDALPKLAKRTQAFLKKPESAEERGYEGMRELKEVSLIACHVGPVLDVDYENEVVAPAIDRLSPSRSSLHSLSPSQDTTCHSKTSFLKEELQQWFGEEELPILRSAHSTVASDGVGDDNDGCVDVHAIRINSLPRNRVLRTTQNSSALINVSEAEGMCNAILEAMALQTLVVAADNEGNIALLRDSCGVLFEREGKQIRLEREETKKDEERSAGSTRSGERTVLLSQSLEEALFDYCVLPLFLEGRRREVETIIKRAQAAIERSFSEQKEVNLWKRVLCDAEATATEND